MDAFHHRGRNGSIIHFQSVAVHVLIHVPGVAITNNFLVPAAAVDAVKHCSCGRHLSECTHRSCVSCVSRFSTASKVQSCRFAGVLHFRSEILTKVLFERFCGQKGWFSLFGKCEKNPMLVDCFCYQPLTTLTHRYCKGKFAAKSK